MRSFQMERMPLREARVDRLADAMQRFELQPSYQRQSDVWSEEKRQLFIDSLINGYDVPKLYFHRLPGGAPPASIYAIVDGKQRLETIRGFVENEFALGEDFEDVALSKDSDVAAGKTFVELTREFPSISSRFMQRELDVVVIETDDVEVIEELFSRLNEAVPLNAPEKRNAIGGAMPPIIRSLVAENDFFRKTLSIENTRYRQYDLAAKFLYLTEQGEFAPTKKKVLDDFVRGYKVPSRANKARRLAARVKNVLKAMAAVFEEDDELLSSVGLVTVYYMAFLLAEKDPKLRARLTRDQFAAFDHLRQHNRAILRRQQAAVARGEVPDASAPIRQDLAIFDRLMQSPNDAQASEYRFMILRAFLENRQFRKSLPAQLQLKVRAR